LTYAERRNLALILLAAFIAILLLTACGTTHNPLPAYEPPLAKTDFQHVRTTAYTRKEKGGVRNALGKYLSGHHVMIAAADWSRFPLGTRFRICSTREEFIIDDYGTALVGTGTIDLYKPTKLEMKRWGVRTVDIDILQWGSEEQSLKVLGPRAKHQTVRRMIAGLQKKSVARASGVAATTKQASSRTASSRTLD